jgi:hypothetical protein
MALRQKVRSANLVDNMSEEIRAMGQVACGWEFRSVVVGKRLGEAPHAGSG